MATSRFGAVIDARVPLCDATTVAAVFDGPPLTADVPMEYVVVWGTEADDDDSTLSQEWRGLGAKSRQESGEVTCALLVGTGGDVVKTARDRALAILAEIEVAVRADLTLGGALTAGWCEMRSAQPTAVRTSDGLYVRVVFTIAYQNKI